MSCIFKMFALSGTKTLPYEILWQLSLVWQHPYIIKTSSHPVVSKPLPTSCSIDFFASTVVIRTFRPSFS